MFTKAALDKLKDSTNVLFAGAGGGYDLYGAVPLAAELWRRGKSVHFANLSFSDLAHLPAATALTPERNLYEIGAAAATRDKYCPEAWFAVWLDQLRGPGQKVWGFTKTGARPLAKAYDFLVSGHGIDAVVLIDGGIDLIFRGDESSIGTPAEDLCSLLAVSELELPTRLAACVGFGSELREGVCHAQALQRIASLTTSGGFFGACSLIGDNEALALYEAAIDLVFANQADVKTSHIHTAIRRSLGGEFGAAGAHTWLSPLSHLYWYFDIATLAKEHLFLRHLKETDHINQVTIMIEACRKDLQIQARSTIPL